MGQDGDQPYESDSSEPEIKKLFNPDGINTSDVSDHGNDSRMTDVSVKNKPLTPTFLIQMRKRQLERAEKREEIRKHHELKAEEKKRKAFEAETKRIQKEEAEKSKKRKERKKLIKEERNYQSKIKQEADRFAFLNRKAKLFNEDRLKRKFGLEPWRQLLQEKRINGFWAEKFHERLLKKRSLQDWIHWTKSNQIMRRVKAEEFEKQKLLNSSFSKWMEVKLT